MPYLYLDLYLTIKVFGLGKYFSKYFFVFVKYLAISYSYSMYSDFMSILRVYLSTFSIYAVKIKINLFVVNKMKLS